MIGRVVEARRLIELAKKSKLSGERTEARRLALEAIQIAPHMEEAWMFLATISSPRASLAYLQQALKINPSNRHIRRTIHWAIKRQRRALQIALLTTPTLRPLSISSQPPAINTRLVWQGIGALAVAFSIVGITLLGWLVVSSSPIAIAKAPSAPRPAGVLIKPTLTATATHTSSPTPSPTATFTPTLTSTPIPTETPTHTPTHTSSPSPQPTDAPISPDEVSLPIGVGKDDNWIDVDLSDQRVRAYTGRELAFSALVSTGAWYTPTVQGQYKIYSKVPIQDMWGPGYYLPDVEHVMYFYKDYGIHSAYWHTDFGTPISHGCINMVPEDAKWLYNFAAIGTTVNIHE